MAPRVRDRSLERQAVDADRDRLVRLRIGPGVHSGPEVVDGKRADAVDRQEVVALGAHRDDRDVALRRLVAVDDLLAPLPPGAVGIQQALEGDVPVARRTAPPLRPDRVALLVLVRGALDRSARADARDRLEERGHALDTPVRDGCIFVISHLFRSFRLLVWLLGRLGGAAAGELADPEDDE